MYNIALQYVFTICLLLPSYLIFSLSSFFVWISQSVFLNTINNLGIVSIIILPFCLSENSFFQKLICPFLTRGNQKKGEQDNEEEEKVFRLSFVVLRNTIFLFATYFVINKETNTVLKTKQYECIDCLLLLIFPF